MDASYHMTKTYKPFFVIILLIINIEMILISKLMTKSKGNI